MDRDEILELCNAHKYSPIALLIQYCVACGKDMDLSYVFVKELVNRGMITTALCGLLSQHNITMLSMGEKIIKFY